jgi:hypothetical protein
MSANPPPYPVEKNFQEPGVYPQLPQAQPPMATYPGGYQQVPAGPPPQGGVYYAPQGPGGQQPQQFVVTQAPVVVVAEPRQNFCLHITLACFTFWCCGCLFGLVAFILAVVAQSSTSDQKSARTLGRISIALSIVGIVLGTIFLIIFIVRVVAAYSAARELCPYVVDGNCYRKREAMTLYSTCAFGYSYNNYCYTERV